MENRTTNISNKWFKRWINTIAREYHKVNGTQYKITTYRQAGQGFKLYEKRVDGIYVPLHRSSNFVIHE